MKFELNSRAFCCAVFVCSAPLALAQHLWWKPKLSDKKFTCIYGEIEVIATYKTIY